MHHVQHLVLIQDPVQIGSLDIKLMQDKPKLTVFAIAIMALEDAILATGAYVLL